MASGKKLTRDEAEEFTRNLGQIAVGNYGMMEMAKNLHVPEALDMDFDEWVQERLGGFVRLSLDQRRAAVAELSGEKTGTGAAAHYVRSAKDVAAILGISEQTVNRDRSVLEVEAAIPEDSKKAISGSSAIPEDSKPLSPAEKTKAIRKLIAEGKSNAEIAVELGIGVSTVGKERAAVRKEMAPKPSPEHEAAKAEKAEREAARPEDEKKAAEAAFDDFKREMMTGFAKLGRLTPIDSIDLAIKTMEHIGLTDYSIETDAYMEMVTRLTKLNQMVWEHGAIAGFDVSEISKWIGRFEGRED